jgi:MFS family permease
VLAHTAAGLSLSGVQAVLPALPQVQEALALSDTQVGMFNAAYLLPSVLLAIPAGFLADRLGRRRTYALALTVFGLCGLLLVFVRPFELMLLVRVVQGAAFAALLPLSITIVGDLLSGSQQVREQQWRMLVMTGSDTLMALLGGALVLVAWYAPFLVHVAALPLALVGWRWLQVDELRTRTRPRPGGVGHLVRLMRTPIAVSIQALGTLRFLFKFSALTYSPILLASRGWSSTEIAIMLAVLSACGVATAMGTRRLLDRVPGSVVMAGVLLAVAASFVALGTVEARAVTIASLLLLGAVEGVFGIVVNAMTLEGVDDDRRASFVAAVGAFRNLGKFLAPALLGLAVLHMPLTTAFVIVGVFALTTLGLVPPLRQLDDHLTREEVTT